MFKPNFTITSEINSRIAEIEWLRAIVGQATIVPELEVQLRFRATVQALSASKRTTQRRLMELVEKRILRIEGQGPATRYVLQSREMTRT